MEEFVSIKRNREADDCVVCGGKTMGMVGQTPACLNCYIHRPSELEFWIELNENKEAGNGQRR